MRLWAIKGIITFELEIAAQPARVIAASFPMTLGAHLEQRFRNDGIDFAGHDREPAESSGRRSSPMPQRGPEPIHRMSLAILIRERRAFSGPRSSPPRHPGRPAPRSDSPLRENGNRFLCSGGQ